MKTRYTAIIDEHGLMLRFLRNIGKDIDKTVELVEVALDMFPNDLKIKVVLLADKSEVSRVYFKRYGKDVNYKAFISLGSMTVFISVRDASLRVFGHEVAHAIVEKFFTERPPYKIHELMAQYAEKHMLER
jgi:hypothetical protein